MINQDLGIATAYGYAKSKGYTGSEDDFATLMANYASVGTSAAASALKSEGFAVGEQNGTPVTSGSPYYQNNAKYYVEQIDGALALAYSSSATYEVGDYVMHSGGLYRCVSAISTAEAWTAGHWTQVSMADEVSDLKSDLNSKIESSFEEVDLANSPYEEVWIRYSNGERVRSGATKTYLFDAESVKYIKWFTASDTNALCAVAFFSTEKLDQSGYMAEDSIAFPSGVYNNGRWYTAEPPEGCKLIAVVTKNGTDNITAPRILINNIYHEEDVDVYSTHVSYEDVWIRYSNGEKVGSNACKTYLFDGEKVKNIKLLSASDSTAVCAIAYYNTYDISTDGYMDEDSVNFNGVHNEGQWYFSHTPDGCKLIAVVTLNATSERITPRILVNPKDLEEYIDIDLTDVPYEGGWIRYSTGEKQVSEAVRLYQIRAEGLTRIQAHLYGDVNVICGIAFYSTESIDTSGYIQSASVAWNNTTGLYWYNADVPDNCKLIAISAKNPTSAYASKLRFDKSNAIAYLSNGFNEYAPMAKTALSKSTINGGKIGHVFPFEHEKFYYHMFMEQVTNPFGSDIIIPSQSIFDVQLASRLGFKYIEANVHKTSDGKYVVTHGISGKLGNDFEDLNGNQVDVTINQTTFDNLRTNYRYRSLYGKYKVPITSLEEFCYQCKTLGISVVLQYVDETELEIAKGILGDNIILYVDNRSVFDGYIMEYATYPNQSQIVNRCNIVGAPYMYCMGNTTDFTDDELKSIVHAVHDVGCHIGFVDAYVPTVTERMRLFALGFDFSASGGMVARFDHGNKIDVEHDIDFDGVQTTGTISNGTIILDTDETVTLTATTDFLQKWYVELIFDGTVTIDGGQVTSDGTESVWYSGTSVNSAVSVSIIAQSETIIKSIIFKVSKC